MFKLFCSRGQRILYYWHCFICSLTIRKSEEEPKKNPIDLISVCEWNFVSIFLILLRTSSTFGLLLLFFYFLCVQNFAQNEWYEAAIEANTQKFNIHSIDIRCKWQPYIFHSYIYIDNAHRFFSFSHGLHGVLWRWGILHVRVCVRWLTKITDMCLCVCVCSHTSFQNI